MDKTVHMKNIEQWSAVSSVYHDNRPTPPHVVVEMVLAWLGGVKPDVVVDAGCGTGLSAAIWRDFAGQVIGIEPNEDMRAVAEKVSAGGNISYQHGFSNDTGLLDNFADVVTMSQAFHWVDADSSLTEFYRILKPGGVLTVYDFMLPPIACWEIEQSFMKLRKMCTDVYYAQENAPIRNDKRSYFQKFSDFGKFRFVRESACHGRARYTPEQLIEFFKSIGNVQFALELEPAIAGAYEAFCAVVTATGRESFDIIFPYTMVIGVK
ncbi:MAG: class I SAM-dependent methyltransferase [Defluviitaleaceae bacterium]|nr:class I SAM-dependent methyltransferase [Defluviitaleaceae bacterium]